MTSAYDKRLDRRASPAHDARAARGAGVQATQLPYLRRRPLRTVSGTGHRLPGRPAAWCLVGTGTAGNNQGDDGWRRGATGGQIPVARHGRRLAVGGSSASQGRDRVWHGGRAGWHNARLRRAGRLPERAGERPLAHGSPYSRERRPAHRRRGERASGPPDDLAETTRAADTVAHLDNPILPHGQDPHVVRHGGLSYLAQSLDDRAITIAAATALTGLAAARPTVVWVVPRPAPARTASGLPNWPCSRGAGISMTPPTTATARRIAWTRSRPRPAVWPTPMASNARAYGIRCTSPGQAARRAAPGSGAAVSYR